MSLPKPIVTAPYYEQKTNESPAPPLPTSNSILPSSFLFLPSTNAARIFSDDYNHKVPLALKFKGKAGRSTAAFKTKMDYKNKLALSEEVKYDTRILSRAVHMRFKNNQLKFQADGGYHRYHQVYLNPTLILKGNRDNSRFKSILGVVIHHKILSYYGRIALNQSSNVILSQRLLANFRGFTIAETHVNNLTTNQHAFRSLFSYKRDKVEATVEVHREKKHKSARYIDLSKSFLSLVYHHSPLTQVGFQVRTNYERKSRRFLLGVSSQVNNDLSIKGKLDQNGKVTISSAYNFFKHLTGNFYFQARTLNRNKPVSPLSQKLGLPLTIGTQFDWVN